MMPEQLGGAVVLVDQQLDALARVLDLAVLADALEARLARRQVLEGLQVERIEIFAAVRRPHHLVEALSALVAQPAVGDQLVEQRIHGGMFQYAARRVVRDRRVQVARHVHGDVDADQVVQAESGGLRATDQRTRQRIDLLDGEVVVERVVDDLRAAHRHETVADEVRLVLGDHHAFAQRLGGVFDDEIDDFRVGVGVGDDFEQVQVARRVEKMRTQEAPREAVAQALGDLADGQPGRVGRDDGVGGDHFRQPRHQAALDVEALDHDFDHPVGVGSFIQIVVNIAGTNTFEVARAEQLRRAGALHALQALQSDGVALGCRVAGLSIAGGDVQQQCIDADAGEQGGNAAAHRAGADDDCLPNVITHLKNLSIIIWSFAAR